MEKSFVSLNYMSAKTAKNFEQWRKVSKKAEDLYEKAVETIENSSSTNTDFVDASCDFTDELEELGLPQKDSDEFYRAFGMWFDDVKSERRTIERNAPPKPNRFANKKYWKLVDEARKMRKEIPFALGVTGAICDAIQQGLDFAHYFDPRDREKVEYAKFVESICKEFAGEMDKDWKAYCEKKGFPEPKFGTSYKDWSMHILYATCD